MPDVVIEVLDVAGGKRQIGSRERVFAELDARRGEIEDAIVSGVDISSAALDRLDQERPWRVTELEISFGVSVSAEAGAIVSKVGGEASFEITVKISREAAHG